MGCEPKSKWFPPPKMSWAFTFVYSSMGFISIFPGILCRTLKSQKMFLFPPVMQLTSLLRLQTTFDFNVLQMRQSSKLGKARFDLKSDSH